MAATRDYFIQRPAEGLTFKLWYDRATRLWTLYPVNAEGHQIGAASYAPTREQAEAEAYTYDTARLDWWRTSR